MKKNIRLKGANDIYLLLKFANERKSCMEGWVKIYRKLLDNPIVAKDGDYLSVWVYLLLNATHTKYDALFKNKRITLLPGQLITSRKSISSKLKINENKVQRVLKCFEIEQQIEQQTSSQNRLISILNWNEYQQNEQQNERQVNNERTTSEHKQECNNKKNIFIYFINKYKSNEKNFEKQMKILSQMRKDEKWDELTHDEQLDLQTAIFN